MEWSVKAVLEGTLDQVVRFQKRRGVDSRAYNFLSLMLVVMTLAGQAFNALLAVGVALLPMLDIGLHLARFVLENAVKIANTSCPQELYLKVGVFLVQLLVAVFMVYLLFSWLILPIWIMAVLTASKMIYYLTGKCVG